MSGSDATGPATPPGSDEAWPRAFKGTALIVLAVSGALALPASLMPGLRQPTPGRPPEAAGTATPGAATVQRFVPRLVGSEPVGTGAGPADLMPILIYRRSDQAAPGLWLRPEGGGTLRMAASGDVVSATEALAYCEA